MISDEGEKSLFAGRGFIKRSIEENSFRIFDYSLKELSESYICFTESNNETFAVAQACAILPSKLQMRLDDFSLIKKSEPLRLGPTTRHDHVPSEVMQQRLSRSFDDKRQNHLDEYPTSHHVDFKLPRSVSCASHSRLLVWPAGFGWFDATVR